MVTNFFEILIPNDEFQTSRLPYSQELLEKLRKEYNEECSFFRNGDYIYASPMKNFSLDLPKPVTLKITENENVVLALIKHIFFRSFRERYPKYLPTSFYPFSIISNKKEVTQLSNILPPDLLKKIDFKKSIVINLRTIKRNDKLTFGFVINTRYKWIFDKNIKELIDEGFKVVGRDVIEAIPVPGLEDILAPNESLLGVALKIDSDYAVVQTNQGEERHLLKNLSLQRSRSNIGNYLEFKIGAQKTEDAFQAIKNFNEMRYNPQIITQDIKEIAALISNIPFRNLDSFYFEIKTNLYHFKNSFNLEETNFIYDFSPGYSSKRVLTGLKDYGPYDSSIFDKKKVNVLVICQRRNRGAVSSFLAKLRDGIPSSKYFKSGLIDLFRLHSVDFEIKEVEAVSPSSLKKAIDESISNNKGNLFDLGIIEGSEYSKQLQVNENPYYHGKLHLLNLGIPTQAIKDNTFRLNDYQLGFILGPLSLQIYAKLGGIPWLLPSAKNVDREIVIGVGSTLIRKNMFADAEQSRIVGITTLFSGDGRYLLGKQLKDVEYSSYFFELLSSLKNSIDSLSKEYGWNEKENVRIVFHIFKPIKNIEADVIKELIGAYPQYNINYAFVNISEKHPFVLLNELISDKKNIYDIPFRGVNFLIDDYNCLLQLRGKNELKTTKQKFSNPVLLKIHKESTFTDIHYIAQQILNFSYMSWRSFNPTHQPVTIFYSELIAKLNSKLKEIGFSSSIIDHHFREKKWFL